MNIHVKKLNSFWSKAVGLIGKKEITSIFFQTRWGIHTFGVLQEIDVVVLNNNYEVVTFKKNLQPNKFFFWNPKYENIFELPKGTIQKEKIKLGSKINIEEI